MIRSKTIGADDLTSQINSPPLTHSLSCCLCVCVCEWKFGSSPSSSRRKFYLNHKPFPFTFSNPSVNIQPNTASRNERRKRKCFVLTVLPVGLEAVDCSTKTQPSRSAVFGESLRGCDDVLYFLLST
ncbi:hypothetical protein LOK49_LG04G00738 [Camellia lanceoleosa]|uniref:Uncharacterized protein n=1 Tax=Camellia lanceoleosa TaxID=1840588 RepID=A0ACC0I1K2_9ERIC|nr:hypothetical protein LOK49_LG04G00738 [Camellia lanceoleosa]